MADERIGIDVVATGNTASAREELRRLKDEFKNTGAAAKEAGQDLGSAMGGNVAGQGENASGQAVAGGVRYTPAPQSSPPPGQTPVVRTGDEFDRNRRYERGDTYFWTDAAGQRHYRQVNDRGQVVNAPPPPGQTGAEESEGGGGRGGGGTRIPSLTQMLVGAVTYQAYGHLMGAIGEGRSIAGDVGESAYKLGVPGVLPSGMGVDEFGRDVAAPGQRYGYSRRESLHAAIAYQKQLGLSGEGVKEGLSAMMPYSRRYAEDLGDMAGWMGGLQRRGSVGSDTRNFVQELSEAIERAQAQGRAGDFREGFRTIVTGMSAKLPQLTSEQVSGALSVQTMLDRTGVRGWMGSVGAERNTRMFETDASSPEARAKMRYLYGFTPTSSDPLASMVEQQEFAAGMPANITAQKKRFADTFNRERGYLGQMAAMGESPENQYRHMAGLFAAQSGGRITATELMPLLKSMAPMKDGKFDLSDDALTKLGRAAVVGPSAAQDDSYAAGQRRYKEMYDRDREWMGRISGRTHAGLAQFFGSTLPGDAAMSLLGVGGQWAATAAGAGAAGGGGAGGAGGTSSSTIAGGILMAQHGPGALTGAAGWLTGTGAVASVTALAVAAAAGLVVANGLRRTVWSDERGYGGMWDDITGKTKKGWSPTSGHWSEYSTPSGPETEKEQAERRATQMKNEGRDINYARGVRSEMDLETDMTKAGLTDPKARAWAIEEYRKGARGNPLMQLSKEEREKRVQTLRDTTHTVTITVNGNLTDEGRKAIAQVVGESVKASKDAAIEAARHAQTSGRKDNNDHWVDGDAL